MRSLACVVAAALVATVAYGSSAGTAAAGPFETRRSTGDVSFEVTPRAPADGRFIFDVRADTHSGDLAELDLRRIVTLEAGGKTLRPTSATSLNGHHASGSVTFEMAAAPDRFTLKMTGVREMDPIEFTWP